MMKNLQRFRACAFFVLTLLSASFAVQAQDIDAIKQAAKDAKVSTDLLPVITNGGIGQQAPIDNLQRSTPFMTSGNSIAIDAVANSEGEVQALLQALQALGFTQEVVSKLLISGYLPIDKLSELKNIAALKYARPTYQPIHRVGAVTSQGDKAMRADIARTTYSVDGTGVKVGIISDSYNNKGGAAAGVTSGDLPAAGVQVILDNPSGGTDEGRGMAELVHDIAPGAAIAFNTANVGGQPGFAKGIRDLAAADCKVITDDVFYYAEPFFQDGVIAQAITDVVNNSGVAYFSSAGNDARTSYQNTFNPISTTIAGYQSAHNFSGGDIRQSFLLRGGGRTSVIGFQWDEPFFSVSGGAGAQTDMDILVYINGALRTDLSGTVNNIGGDPLEIFGIRNGGSDITIELVLAKKSGNDPNLLKWVFFGNGITTTIEYDTKSSTAVGHNNSSRCISVGAAPYFNTPAYNNALTTATIEGFSSAGGCPILFTTSGARINGTTGVTLQKPEITSVDGTNTTFFGNDYEGDGFPNFFGTSAAAPHAAAVAALMKQKVPSITRDAILSAMETTALDMDDPSTVGFDAGFDFGTGYGFIQADRALQAITPTSLSLIVSANPTTILTTGTTTLSATVSGGTTPYSYTFTGPGTIMPSGNTATVSNLPAGVQTFTVRAKDATSPTSQTISGTVSVTVNMAPPGNTPPTVANPVPPQSATVGVAYTLSLANVFTDAETPSQLTLSVAGLPAGLMFTAPATISGTPSMSGVSMVTVTATDPGSLTGSTSFMLTVSPAAGTPPPMGGSFAIVGVTNVSCATVSVGQRTLSFTPQYSGLNGMPVSFSVANEMLPTTAPGPYTLNLYTDNPVITLKAVQSGTAGEASFAYNWLVACNGGTPPPPPPTTGTFSITGVTTVSCTTLSVGARMLSFTPQYSGLNGMPVSFSVANEMLPTTAPGPYSLRVYTDNPVITLKAVQSGTEASFAYNWLNACSGGSPGSARVGGSELTATLRATLLPNPVGSEFRVRIEGGTRANGRSVVE